MLKFSCPYLGGEVELPAERERHITGRHPELGSRHLVLIREVLAEPDLVRRSARAADASLLSRWYTDFRDGKHVVVVVLSEPVGSGRHWIVTAYVASRLRGGRVEWMRG